MSKCSNVIDIHRNDLFHKIVSVRLKIAASLNFFRKTMWSLLVIYILDFIKNSKHPCLLCFENFDHDVKIDKQL